MVVRILSFAFLLVASVATTTSVIAKSSTDITQSNTIQHLSKKVAISTERLTSNITFCNNSKAEIVVKFHKGEEKSPNRNNVFLGLSYLKFRNMNNCILSSKAQLAYDLGVLKNTQNHYKISTAEVEQVESNLIYPSLREIQLEIMYLNLPELFRNHLERKVGNIPFDFDI